MLCHSCGEMRFSVGCRGHDWLMHELNQSFCEQGVIESLDANLT